MQVIKDIVMKRSVKKGWNEIEMEVDETNTEVGI